MYFSLTAPPPEVIDYLKKFIQQANGDVAFSEMSTLISPATSSYVVQANFRPAEVSSDSQIASTLYASKILLRIWLLAGYFSRQF